MFFFDFNSKLPFFDNLPKNRMGGIDYARGQNNLCASDGYIASIRIQQMRRKIPRRLSRAIGPKLYHSGIRSKGARSTLADANEKHDWRIFADFARVLIAEASALYANEDFGVELKQAAYALDSTTIDLCLSLFPWAKFRKTKAAIKLHTLLDLRGNVPSLVIITSGKVHDVTILDELFFDAGAFYIMDRGYLDFLRLHRIQVSSAFFVTLLNRTVLIRSN